MRWGMGLSKNRHGTYYAVKKVPVHSDGTVHAKYGAKEIARRFRHRLSEAVASVTYNGLDLSHLAAAKS